MTGRPADTIPAGSARVEITPPLTVPHLGWPSARHAFFTGVHDPLYARAVVLGEGAERVALLSVDAIGLGRRILGPGRDFIAEVRERVQRVCGIQPARIMISATHAHSTPETIGFRPLWHHPGAAEWLEILADRLAAAVVAADSGRQAVLLKQATGTAEGIGWSRRILCRDGSIRSFRRRPPEDEIICWGANDPAVTVLCLETPDGRPATVLVHFTCHPVTVQVNPLVSADFPGAAAAWVEGAGIGCDNCLYLQGACGSINPVRDTTDFTDVARYGQILAGEVVKLIGIMSAPDYPTEPPIVAAGIETVMLPSRDLPDAEGLRAERDRQLALAATASDESCRQQAANTAYLLEEQLARVELGTGPFPAEVQALRIGNLALVGIPAEPFAEFGLAVRNAGFSLNTLCLGYTNDYLGYVAPEDAWRQGGYEVSLGMWSIAGPQAFSLLMGAARRALECLT